MHLNPRYQESQSPHQEEKIWIRNAKKNPQDFAPLYEKYYEAIFRFIYQRMDDKELAFDITSQVFIKAIQHINSFEDRGFPFSSWLYRIAKSELYQSFRDRKTTRFVQIETVQLTSILNDFDEEESEKNISKILTEIKKLKTKEIQLIEMRFFEKRSFKEIADILDITENNAKVKTFRIIEKLKKGVL